MNSIKILVLSNLSEISVMRTIYLLHREGNLKSRTYPRTAFIQWTISYCSDRRRDNPPPYSKSSFAGLREDKMGSGYRDSPTRVVSSFQWRNLYFIGLISVEVLHHQVNVHGHLLHVSQPLQDPKPIYSPINVSHISSTHRIKFILFR